jgi:hypothetical protein
MDVHIKMVKKFEINTVEELEKFIKDNGVKKHFISFPSDIRPTIIADISNTDKINLKELKTVFLKKYLKEGSCLNSNYWLERGYSKEEADIRIVTEQQVRANKFHKKRRTNPNLYKGYTPTQLDYWLQRGYTLTDATNLLKQRQSTFSKKKLLETYDEKTALEILNNRNEKWFNSLKENNDWSELSLKKGRNGLNSIKTLSRHIEFYGEVVGKIKFAKRYWGIDIKTVDEFDGYENFLNKERTTLFYDKHYRELILNEQNSKCAECGIGNSNSKFHLHHIDYNKLNDNRENLIFLCHSCHSKTTNSKRNKWIKYYTDKNKKYYDKKI